MNKREMLETLHYFWDEKRDIERWAGFDREKIAAEYPEIIKAWDDYSTSKRVMSAVINGLMAETKGD